MRPSIRDRVLCRLALAAMLVMTVASCGIVGGGGGGGYELTVYFDRAVSLYELSEVKVMGLPAGTVTEVEPEGDRVRVELEIDEDVPVPADVQATVVPLSLIGERNVVLFPAWQTGMDRAGDGDVIPVERTELPVEVDEALAAFNDLATEIDPEGIGDLITNSAEVLDGRGEQFNDTLGQVADLTDLLATEDDSIVAVAENLNELAGTLNEREATLGRVIDGFAAATDVLVAERENVETFLAALGDFTRVGEDFVTTHEQHLRTDLVYLARQILVTEANIDSVAQAVRALDATGAGLVRSYIPETRSLLLRVAPSASLRVVLEPLYEALGVTGLPTCVPLTGLDCQPTGPAE